MVDPRRGRAQNRQMLIADKKVVSLNYTLRNKAGQVLDSSEGQDPLEYLHGASQIVPGLERELTGLKTGDTKDVVVAPEEGYGSHDPQGVFAVPRNAFPADAQLEVGQTFLGEDDEGQSVPVRVLSVGLEEITVDANHPLAGETLYFHVDVVAVRDATAEELQHGHVHGPDGEHHG
jgi:FKBP-type peptidyl-prolyl cis-trans isomerase SlyD